MPLSILDAREEMITCSTWLEVCLVNFDRYNRPGVYTKKFVKRVFDEWEWVHKLATDRLVGVSESARFQTKVNLAMQLTAAHWKPPVSWKPVGHVGANRRYTAFEFVGSLN